MPHTLSEEQDALIVACEDDRYVVVAGTFEKLVEQLAGDEKPGKYNLLLWIMYLKKFIMFPLIRSTFCKHFVARISSFRFSS